MNFVTQGGETIIKEGKANRTSIIRGQGGTLTLTDQRLVFVGHGKNFGQGTISINFSDILSFDKAVTFVVFFPIPIPNAIKISLNNGNTYKFTVTKRTAWIEEIQKAINKSRA